MPTKTAVRPDRLNPRKAVAFLLGRTGAAIVRNPVYAGAGTALAISMMFFSANALWYQPHAHESPFFKTRPNPFVSPLKTSADSTGSIIGTNTRNLVKSSPNPATGGVTGDPVVARVQEILSGLNLYSGEVDGLPGPQTRGAILTYQQTVGLEPTGEISEALLVQLGERKSGQSALPVPRPAPRNGDDLAKVITRAVPARYDPAAATGLAIKVQAGLRAFGNDQIELDGVIGAQTKAAILEFQTLFKLPRTGEIDEALVAKMEEVGLIGR